MQLFSIFGQASAASFAEMHCVGWYKINKIIFEVSNKNFRKTFVLQMTGFSMERKAWLKWFNVCFWLWICFQAWNLNSIYCNCWNVYFKIFLSSFTSRHSRVQSSQQNYLNRVWNVFRVNNKDTRTTPLVSFWCFYC